MWSFRNSKVVKALRAHEPNAYLDVHLCVTQPAQYLEELAKAGDNLGMTGLVSMPKLHWEF